jgi:HAMP domain-containing protein
MVLLPLVENEAGAPSRQILADGFEDQLEGLEAAQFVPPNGMGRTLFGNAFQPPGLDIEGDVRHLEEGFALLKIGNDPQGNPQIFMGFSLPGEAVSSGLIWVRLDQEFLWGTATAYIGLSPNATFCILEGDLNPLFCTVPDSETFLRALSRAQFEPMTSEAGLRFRSFEWKDARGETYLAGTRRIFLRPTFFLAGLEVAVTEPRSTALSAMHSFQSAFWRVVLVGLVAVALLSNIQIRRSLDPLHELRKGTRRLAEGRFEERVSISSKDEFEDLAGSFNTMAQELESQFHALATIGEIDRAILSDRESDGIIETALLRAGDLLPCDLVAVCRLDWLGAREGRIRIFNGPDGKLGPDLRVLLSSEDLTSLGAMDGYQLAEGDETAAQYFGAPPGTLGVAKAVVIPLSLSEGMAGFLAVGRQDAVPFTGTELGRLMQIGKQLSIALSNAWLLEELDRMSWGALTALARTIDAKSPWTSGHSEQVANLSVAIGRGMGLPKATLTALQRGGLVHDIGKIAVRSSILDKNGKLTNEEREVIQSHPEEGVRILEPVPAMEPILPMVLHHHEAWDGSGYPLGLAGEDIPLEARIMAVADQFDALSSDRPYRKGLGLERTLDYLREQSGRGLDPRIVRVFIELLEAGELPIQTPVPMEAQA